jgi:hypothetical protein
MSRIAVLAVGAALLANSAVLAGEEKPQLGETEASVSGCRFLGQKEMIALIAADLDTLSISRAKGTRYLTLTHLASICAKERVMEVYRQGAIKLANSLSRSSEVVRLETIDPLGSVLRVNIEDLGWDAADWETLAANYPYGARPETRFNSLVDERTGTKNPFIRADWFASVASRPGMYEKLLKLPKTFQELATQEGVDVAGNIRRFVAQRAGFQKSGVSAHNRLIERHPSRNGYFWTSYDFGGNRAKQNLFEFPVGPGGARGFTHDGGETIFSLPNGFQAYFLSDSKGEALAKAPVNIVSDPDNPRDPSVVNGISCMRCHELGIRRAKDEIRGALSISRAQPKEIREQVEALHPPAEKMDRLMENDSRRFQSSMKRAGLNVTLKFNGMEMISALSRAYEQDLDINQAASELGLDRDGFLKATQDADKRFQTLVRRLRQGTVSRDEFETSFKELIAEVTD